MLLSKFATGVFGCLAQPTTRPVSYKLIVFGCLAQHKILAEASQIYFWAWLRRNAAFELRSAAWLTWPLGFGDASQTLLPSLSSLSSDASQTQPPTLGFGLFCRHALSHLSLSLPPTLGFGRLICFSYGLDRLSSASRDGSGSGCVRV
jgi:hypothetical protein